MKLKNIIGVLIVAIMICSFVSVSATESPVQLYFEPEIMNDVTGELKVGVGINNYDVDTHIKYGDAYNIGFSFIYDTSAFDIVAEDGKLNVMLSDDTLIKNENAITAKVDEEKGKVDFEFKVSEQSEDLIGFDGKLFTFTFMVKNVSGFWNSFDTYPLRFVPGSISLKTYDYLIGQKYELENIKAYDCNVASYNSAPTLTPKSVDKTVEFTAGSKNVVADGKITETDATPFEKAGTLMVPVRYFAENINMQVEWNDGEMLACAYADCITLKVSVKENKTYINNALIPLEVEAEEVDGRIYVPINIAEKMYHGAKCTFDGEKAVIYIP